MDGAARSAGADKLSLRSRWNRIDSELPIKKWHRKGAIEAQKRYAAKLGIGGKYAPLIIASRGGAGSALRRCDCLRRRTDLRAICRIYRPAIR